MHLVQLASPTERRVAVVQEPRLILLRDVSSVYELVHRALDEGSKISSIIEPLMSDKSVSYDEVYSGESTWKLLAPADHPSDPQRVLVSGTGLTHMGSARERQAMHAASAPQKEVEMTDSMRMFEWGRERGRPEPGAIGIAPEWFYKGDGSVVQKPFDPLVIPFHAEDGGEEGEIAAIYIVASDGTPHRIGFATGNEFSDHVFERRNYLNLAGSKLRMCSLGPELVISSEFSDVKGNVRVLRDDSVLWEKNIRTGEENMCHSLANLEHHHFKFAVHRQPGTLHIHFLGADALSFGDKVRLQPGDITEVQFEGMGRALVNSIAAEQATTSAVRVQAMN